MGEDVFCSSAGFGRKRTDAEFFRFLQGLGSREPSFNTGKFPKPGQNAGSGTFSDGKTAAGMKKQNCSFLNAAFLRCGFYGKAQFFSLLVGETERAKRAGGSER